MQNLEAFRKIIKDHVELTSRPGVPESEREYWYDWKDQLDYGRPQTRPEYKPAISGQPSRLVCD